MSNPLWNPRTTPNNSERLETTPNDSKQLRTPPNNSKHDSRVGVKLYLDLYTTKLPDTPGRIHYPRQETSARLIRPDRSESARSEPRVRDARNARGV